MKPLLEIEYMAAILIFVFNIKSLKTWLAINEESILWLYGSSGNNFSPLSSNALRLANCPSPAADYHPIRS